MYVGYVDNALLFTTGRTGAYSIASGKLSQGVNCASAFNFLLPANSASAGGIIPRKSVLKVERDGAEIFRGTVSTQSRDLAGNFAITAEDLIAYTNTIQCNYAEIDTSTPANVIFTAVLAIYNAAVDTAHKLTLGLNQVTKSVKLKPLGKDKAMHSVFEVFKALVQETGGYIRIRYEDGNAYLDFVESLDVENPQIIQFGKNLIDMNSVIDGAGIVSRVYATGKVTEDEYGDRTWVSIEDINDGLEYVMNQGVEDEYGRSEYYMDVDSEDPQVIKAAAQAYLTTHSGLKKTINLTALDLSLLDNSLDNFTAGDLVRVVVPHLGIDTKMPVTRVDINLTNPAKSKITLGDESTTITGAVINNNAAATDGAIDDSVEYGKSGKWTYKKYANGDLELWASFSPNNVPITTAWGNWYYGTWMNSTANKTARKYPIPFVARPFVIATAVPTDTSDFVLMTDASDNMSTDTDGTEYAPAYMLCRPTTRTVTEPIINYYVKGRWKI